MGTKVLRSQAGYLQHRFRREALALTTSQKTSHFNHGSRSHRRMQSPIAVQAKKRDRYESRLCNQSPGTNPVMGQVKILKRGEKFSFDGRCLAVDDSNEKHNAEAKSERGLDRPGRNQVRVDSEVEKYAGSCFDVSPSPGLVPVPQFLGKKKLRLSVT